MNKTCFLIGFMGSGKTYWGERLAARTGRPFIDLDVAMEAGEGKSISALFAQKREPGFRRLERRYLHRLAGLSEPGIVATGGGTPCFFDNIGWMNKHGVTVYLKTPVDVLAARLRLDRTTRPLLQGIADQELEQYIGQLIGQREPYYGQAQYILTYAGQNDLFWEQLLAAMV